jgi:hypothetical protein
MAILIGGSRSITDTSTDGHGRYTVKGTWAYSLGGKRALRTKRESQKFSDAHIQAVAKRGYKLGVKVKRAQSVELFSFRGAKQDIVLAVDKAVSRELMQAFGAGADEKWVGLVPPPGTARKASFPELGVVAYTFTLVVSGVKHEPQALVIPVTHQDTAFRQHYLIHVQMLSTRPARITTDIRALFTAGAGRP